MRIKSTAALNGSFFEHTTILIVEHDEAGTIGFVSNKPFGKSLHKLIEFNHSKPFPLMDGGPVDRDRLFVLHKRPDLIDGGQTNTQWSLFGRQYGAIDPSHQHRGRQSTRNSTFYRLLRMGSGRIGSGTGRGKLELQLKSTNL